MNRTIIKSVFSLTIALFLIGFSGCILSPTVDKLPPPKPTYVYLDLTHKEDAVKNLVTAYKQHNIDEYTKLLHTDYIWRNQDNDIAKNGLPEFVSREADVAMTNNIFSSADGHGSNPALIITKLTLTIKDATYSQVLTFNGQPCDDCWQTTREYTIEVGLEGDNGYYGNDLVIITIAPETVDGKKLYKIGRMDDRQQSAP